MQPIKNKNIREIFRLARKTGVELLFFASAYMLGIVILIAGGMVEKFLLQAAIIGGFLIISLLRNWARKSLFKKEIQTQKRILTEVIVYLVILELFLLFVIPMSSLVPDRILLSAGIVHPLDHSLCDVTEELDRIRQIWGNRIDYEKIRIVDGGLMSNLWYLEEHGWLHSGNARTAMTNGNAIYLYSALPCPSPDVYVHEMTHVWQYQKERSSLFGFHTIAMHIRIQYYQIVDPDVLYDYGGEVGLHRAQQQGKKFRDFGPEQQAMIVEDFYYSGVRTTTLTGEYITPEYKKLLGYYVQDMLGQN